MTADFFSTSNLVRLARKIFLIGLAIWLVIEVLMWIFVRLPKDKMMTVKLNNQIPGVSQKVTLTFDAETQLRSLNWTPGEKAAGSLRILCLGGNATFAQFQNAPQTWWGQLASQLEAALPGVKVEIGSNATAATALGLTKWAVSHLDAWKPDLVIANVGAGDVLIQPLDYRYDPNRYDYLPSGGVEVAGWKKSLLGVSQIARWFRSRSLKSEMLRTERQIGAENFFTDNMTKMRAEMAKVRAIPNPFRLSDADPRNEYKDAIGRLISETSSRGIKLIVSGEASLCSGSMSPEAEALRTAFIPKSSGESALQKVEAGWVEREIRRFQEVAQELATQKNVPFVDLNGEVPQDPAHFINDTAVTDAGAAVIAKLLLPKVLPMAKEISGK